MGRVAHLLLIVRQSESFTQRPLGAAPAALGLHTGHHDDGLLPVACAGTGSQMQCIGTRRVEMTLRVKQRMKDISFVH